MQNKYKKRHKSIKQAIKKYNIRHEKIEKRSKTIKKKIKEHKKDLKKIKTNNKLLLYYIGLQKLIIKPCVLA